MERNTKEIGKTISKVDRVRKVGLTEQYMKVIMQMVRSMDLEFLNGQTAQSTKGTFLITILKVMGHTHGQITESMKGIGFKTKCMEQANFHGQMVDSMKESI